MLGEYTTRECPDVWHDVNKTCTKFIGAILGKPGYIVQ